MTTEAATSTTGREIYFNNMKHSNHRETERILPIRGGSGSAVYMSVAAEMYRAKQRLRRRGGRPPTSEAIEFVLELPRGFRPTEAQWKLVVDDVIKQVAETCEIDVKNLSKTVRAVVHQQQQEIVRDKKTGRIIGSGDHCHLMIGKFTLNGEYLRNLQRKTCTSAVKAAFNQATLKHCDFDWRAYAERERIEITTKNSYSKRSNKWIVDAKRVAEVDAKNRRNDAVLRENFQIIRDQTVTYGAAIERLIGQAEKWLSASENGDKKQMDRQVNRMNKEVGIINGALATLPESDDLTKKLVESATAITSRVNERSGGELIQPISQKRGF